MTPSHETLLDAMAGAWPSLAVTLAVFAGLWVLSLRKSDCGVVDLYWSWGFAVIAWMGLGSLAAPAPAQWAFAGLVTLWAARLGVHLALRHQHATGEDARYRAMREAHGPGWERRSFWMVFMLQAVVLWIVASPVHVAMTSAPAPLPPWLAAASIVLFATGLIVETVADAALLRFRRNPENRGRLLTSGLFAWSRHPNYFGESVLWCGLGLGSFGVSGSWLAFLAPVLLTLLLLKVSGVPLLEEQLRSRPGFADYAARTSAFIPLPPRRPGEPA
jgi:steroid 5-alpha reductase family enzyme